MTLENVCAFRDAAIADGWTVKPMSPHESVDTWARLTRDGYVMHAVARPPRFSYSKPHASISIWAPDTLGVCVPETYSWNEIQRLATVCDNCMKECEKTVRYSFAGRCCETCLPEMRAKYEQPGWDD